MIQSTATVSAVDNLFVYNPKSVISDNTAKADQIVHEVESASDFLKAGTVLIYNHRVRLTAKVKLGLKEFILLRGLIEFHRPANFFFTYDRKERTIEADFRESEFESLKEFLNVVSGWLNTELGFRSSLRKIIDFEARYRAERNSLYGLLLK
jgi:hypothetical protein